METNANSLNISPAENLCLQASCKKYWAKHRDSFENKTGFNRNLKKGMAYLLLILFVMFIGIMTLSKISKHGHESNLISTKSSFGEKKTDQLSSDAETDPKMETATKNAEITGQDDIDLEIKDFPIYSESNGRLSARKKRSPTLTSENLMGNPNLLTSNGFESPLELYFDKMEILSAHIDRLHERYMRLNILDDDYISREFSVESPLKDDNVD